MYVYFILEIKIFDSIHNNDSNNDQVVGTFEITKKKKMC